jgi:hypothetical protein
MWEGLTVTGDVRPQPKVEWVVIDANAFGGGRLQIDQVEGLAGELAEVDVEVVVPEVVLWEWAEHALRDLTELEKTAKQLRNRIGRAGLSRLHPAAAKQAVPKVPPILELVELARASLEGLANVRVLPASPAGALAGLRSQVLQTGAGKRKPTGAGTKTGAADTAWIYDVFELAERDADRLVFLSGDRDVVEACAELGSHAPKIYAQRIDVLNALRELREEEARDAARLVAQDLLTDLPHDARTGHSVEDLHIPAWLDTNVETTKAGARSNSELVMAITLARVSGVAAVRNARTDGRLTTATVELIGDVDVDVASTTVDDDSHDLTLTTRRHTGVVIEVPVSAALDRHHQVTDVSAAGHATLLPGDAQHDDVLTARQELADALGAFPTLPSAEWWSRFFETGESTVERLQLQDGRTPRATRAHWEFPLLVGNSHALTITIGPDWSRPGDGSVRVRGELEADEARGPLRGVPTIVAVVAELEG